MAISSAYLKILTLGLLDTTLFVYTENRKGERTQPCGAPVLLTKTEDYNRQFSHVASYYLKMT